jgi:hypothetical protein
MLLVVEKCLSPSFELSPLRARKEELVCERDHSFSVSLTRRDAERRYRLPVSFSWRTVVDGTSTEVRAQCRQEMSVARRNRYLKDPPHPKRAVGEWCTYRENEATLAGDETGKGARRAREEIE